MKKKKEMEDRSVVVGSRYSDKRATRSLVALEPLGIFILAVDTPTSTGDKTVYNLINTHI